MARRVGSVIVIHVAATSSGDRKARDMNSYANQIIVQARIDSFRREAEREALARAARNARPVRDGFATRLLGRLHPTPRLAALDSPLDLGPAASARTDRTPSPARRATAGTAD
jgi:hypothetical protein